MKKLFYLLLILPFLTVACSDDDDDNNKTNEVVIDPSVVFSAGQPKEVADMALTYNTDGLVTRIAEENVNVRFDYSENVKTKATLVVSESDVVMTYRNWPDSSKVYMQIGANGFVKSAFELDTLNRQVEPWAFTYNADGQLTEIKRTNETNEVTTLTYQNGNIVKVGVTFTYNGEKGTYDANIAYTSDKHTAGLANKGGVMMFNETFGIVLDQMVYAYYAGLLGKGTKQLPLKLTDVKYNDITDFEWTLNSNGLATSFSFLDGEDTITSNFKW